MLLNDSVRIFLKVLFFAALKLDAVVLKTLSDLFCFSFQDLILDLLILGR